MLYFCKLFNFFIKATAHNEAMDETVDTLAEVTECDTLIVLQE